VSAPDARQAHYARRFAGGLSLQFTNPMIVLFFFPVLPQFISPARDFAPQFVPLVLTYGALLIVIHCGYALFACRARTWPGSNRGPRLMIRASGVAFIAFGAALATANR
jgi:threonine/homoserine/homoserine lactone efflux protein